MTIIEKPEQSVSLGKNLVVISYVGYVDPELEA